MICDQGNKGMHNIEINNYDQGNIACALYSWVESLVHMYE